MQKVWQISYKMNLLALNLDKNSLAFKNKIKNHLRSTRQVCVLIKNRRTIVMELAGENLYDLHKLYGRQFSVQTTISLAIEFLSMIESIHQMGMLFLFLF